MTADKKVWAQSSLLNLTQSWLECAQTRFARKPTRTAYEVGDSDVFDFAFTTFWIQIEFASSLLRISAVGPVIGERD